MNLKGQDDWKMYCKSGEKPEFIPSNPVLQITIALQKPVIKTNYIIEDEDVFFDRLEYEFVQQNVWLFE